MLRKSILGAAGLLTVAGSLAFNGCSSDEEQPLSHGQDEATETGEIEAALTLPGGATLNSITYTVTGSLLSSPRTKTVDVSNSSVLRFQVGDLPGGSGYSISITGTDSSGNACSVSSPFTVQNNTVTTLMLTLTCAGLSAPDMDTHGDVRVNATVEIGPGAQCPSVTGVSSLPLETASGAGVALEAFVSQSTGITYAWSGDGGAFSAPTATASNFTCSGVGERTLTFTATKTGCAPATTTVPVTCSARKSSQAAYLVPTATGVTTKAILTAGDAAGTKPDGSPYRMVGIPDGLGAFNNADGTTFTLLSNHELGANTGVVRAHGSNGAFVSKWTINKSDLGVVSGQDLMQSVQLWNKSTSAYAAGTVSFNRFCSADLAPVSAWYANNVGFNGQLFLDGEEGNNNGRAMAHGLDGVSYELPRLGQAAWENLIASPFAQSKTIVVGTDDTSPQGQVYVYVGTKQATGTSVAQAGLTNGNLYGIAVTGFASEPSATGIPTGAFTLANLGNVENVTGDTLNTANAAVTLFNRPEDGAWDPSNPNDFYFVTTNGITAPSRLWRLRFTDIMQPEMGGTISMMLDGTEGQLMLDNIAIDGRGHIMLVEDVGDNAHIGQVFRYDIASDSLHNIAQHDPNRFVSGASMFLTQDEEASGIIDATAILGAGHWLVDVQAHFTISGEVVQGGQYLDLYDPGSL